MLSLRPLAVSLALVLAAPVALAQPSSTPVRPATAPTTPQLLWIGDLDTNQDGRISAQEVAGRPELAKAFASMDLNHDGYLSNSEVQTLWQQRIAATNARQRAARIARFDKADTNKDGKLTLAEAKAGMPAVARTFTALDAKKVGYLTRDQVAAAGQLFTRIEIGQMRQRNAQAFAALDTNKDGKLSKVELEAKMPRLAKSFAFLDENHDGFLSSTEFTLPQG
jgi:Ca2+-binding EF-hand superfamily protein